MSFSWYTLLCMWFAISSASHNWETWKSEYGKEYSNQREDVYRRLIWERKLDFVVSHNQRLDKEFSVHMNRFADLNGDEPRSHIHVVNHNAQWNSLNSIFSGNDAPSSFDWRQRGVIGPVHDQGRIGDIQSIVAAEMIASHHAIDTGRLFELSAEEISQCGCGQEQPDPDIFSCIHKKIPKGLCTNSTYNAGGGTCNKASCSPVAKVDGSRHLAQGNEDEMASVILQTPLMVYIDASQPSFELYQSGIYSDAGCSQLQLDHILQIVGYGEDNGVKYWICRNSWGTDWGINGYIWIKRGENVCGIATNAFYPY